MDGGGPSSPETDAASPDPPKPKKLTKAERKALEEQRKRAAAREAAKRGPKNAPKMGKFVADREQADEKLRVVGLHKEFAERGKIPPKMIYPLFIKDLLRPIKPDSLIAPLTAMAKEALAAKAGDKGLTAGDFAAWYFDTAWPMIVDARAAEAAKIKAKQAAEAAAAAEAEAAARKAREEEEEALQQQIAAQRAAKAEAAEAARAAEAAKAEEEAAKAKEMAVAAQEALRSGAEAAKEEKEKRKRAKKAKKEAAEAAAGGRGDEVAGPSSSGKTKASAQAKAKGSASKQKRDKSPAPTAAPMAAASPVPSRGPSRGVSPQNERPPPPRTNNSSTAARRPPRAPAPMQPPSAASAASSSSAAAAATGSTPEALHELDEEGDDDESSDGSNSEPEPAGFMGARGLDADEARRVLTLLSEYAVDGHVSSVTVDGKLPDAMQGGWPELVLLEKSVPGVLRQLLEPVSDDALLDRAPQPSIGSNGVPIGKLIKFWFDVVWPKHYQLLRGAGGGAADDWPSPPEPDPATMLAHEEEDLAAIDVT